MLVGIKFSRCICRYVPTAMACISYRQSICHLDAEPRKHILDLTTQDVRAFHGDKNEPTGQVNEIHTHGAKMTHFDLTDDYNLYTQTKGKKNIVN